VSDAQARAIEVIAHTPEHFRLIVANHHLKAQEAADPARPASLVQKFVDSTIGFPQGAWHQ
jgi:hypothetical protein